MPKRSRVLVRIDGSSLHTVASFRVGDTVTWRLAPNALISSRYKFVTMGGGPHESAGPLIIVLASESGSVTTGEVARMQLVACVIGDPGTVADGWTTPVPLPETARFTELTESVEELIVEEIGADNAMWDYLERFLLVELLIEVKATP